MIHSAITQTHILSLLNPANIPAIDAKLRLSHQISTVVGNKNYIDKPEAKFQSES